MIIINEFIKLVLLFFTLLIFFFYFQFLEGFSYESLCWQPAIYLRRC